MISDSDSGSDSDDCLVYKTVRPVVWSDEEEEKPKVNAGAGSRRAREEGDDSDEVVCATSASARKRARTARAATTSKADVDVVEIEEETPPSAADAFLAPPPANARGVVQSVDVATLESVFASRRRMAELRAAAAAPVEAPETIADFPPSVAGDAGRAGKGAGSSSAAVGGKIIAVVFQTPRGARREWSCSDARAFSSILGDFFASEDGGEIRRELGETPALLFDGDVVDMSKAPRDVEDLEDGDVLDLK